jgi:hypothetical protein
MSLLSKLFGKGNGPAAETNRLTPVEDAKTPPAMPDYYSLIESGVSNLANNTKASREALYSQARTALLAELRGRTPPLSESDILREQRSFAATIYRLEGKVSGEQSPAPKGDGNAPELSQTKRDKAVKSSALLIGKLLSLQLVPTGDRLADFEDEHAFSPAELRDAFSSLMTNRLAAGYVFGFYDSYLQRMTFINVRDPNAGFRLIKFIYQNHFGDQAGLTLFNESINLQDDPTFQKGRQNGGTEIAKFLELRIPPIGLGRILILGLED